MVLFEVGTGTDRGCLMISVTMEKNDMIFCGALRKQNAKRSSPLNNCFVICVDLAHLTASSKYQWPNMLVSLIFMRPWMEPLFVVSTAKSSAYKFTPLGIKYELLRILLFYSGEKTASKGQAPLSLLNLVSASCRTSLLDPYPCRCKNHARRPIDAFNSPPSTYPNVR